MAHQVFLSYATEDADSARLLCRILEAEEGIRCWIAPRDVEAGTDYAAAILDAIKNTELVLLLFSTATNASPYVLREIERAVAYERPVISVRLDAASPNASLEYYLNMLQWLDAPRGIESKRREIVAAVRARLDNTENQREGVRVLPAQLSGAAGSPSSANSRSASSHVSGAVEGERKLVTVLATEICDFADLSRELDPETLHHLVNACFDRLALSIERHGGTIDRSSQGGLLALFGIPQAHENDAERALHAALEMNTALGSFNKRRPVPVAVRFGVSTGLVYASGPEADKRHDHSVIGDAVNAAVGLCRAATPGEILVGPETYRQVEYRFSWHATGGVAGKRRPAPLPSRRLLGALSGGDRSGRGLDSPLVGREKELSALAQCLTRLRQGGGGVALITGDAGLGKSRLIAEARDRAERDGVAWLQGHALSFGRTISYWPLIEIIQEDAGIDSDDPESERWAKLASRTGSLFGEERDEILPYLGTLLSLALPDELAQKVRYFDGEAMGRHVYRAVRLHFSRLAQRRATVVVFEDLHWLDGSTASILEHLLPLAGEVPILFCLATRPEQEGTSARIRELLHSEHQSRLTEITLRALSAEESVTLVRNLAHVDELSPRLKDTILGKAEGNPFFVEEVVRSLIDLGGLAQDDEGRWRLTEHAARITIPDTLHGLIMARIDCLDDDLKHTLRLASVVGRTFFHRVLVQIAEHNPQLDGSLAALEGRELIREKSREPELEYMFKHALVQEATYESIPLARRKDLHGHVAAAVEALFAERPEEVYSLIAYHYSKAEDWEKAQYYLFKAGDQAGRIAADTEALAHYEDALDAYARAFGDRWDQVERAGLERKIGEAQYRRGDIHRSEERLQRGLRILGRPCPETPSAVRRAIVIEIIKQFGHRLSPRHGRRTLTPEAARNLNERCIIYDLLSTAQMFTDPAASMLTIVRMLNEAESGSVGWAAAQGEALVALMFGVAGNRFLGHYYLGCARQTVKEGGWPRQAGWTDFVDGCAAIWVEGDFDATLAHLRRGAEQFERVGDIRTSFGMMRGMAVHVPAERGRFEEARRVAEEMEVAGRDSGDRLTEVYGQAWQAELTYLTGDIVAGEAGMRQTAGEILNAGDNRIGVKVSARLARCLLDQGRLEEAQTILADLRERVRKYYIAGGNASMVFTGWAAAALAAVEQADGAGRQAALKEADRACAAALKRGNMDTTSLVPAYRHRGTYEWLRGNARKADEWWNKSLRHAERLGARYEGTLTILEQGTRRKDRELLEKAEEEFAEMGVRSFQAKAREHLDGLAAFSDADTGAVRK